MSASILPAAWPMLSAAAALAVVLGLILLAQRIARHRLIRPQSRLAVAETVALDSRRRLHLLRCDGRFLLLATGGPQDVALGWLPEVDATSLPASDSVAPATIPMQALAAPKARRTTA